MSERFGRNDEVLHIALTRAEMKFIAAMITKMETEPMFAENFTHLQNLKGKMFGLHGVVK